MATIKQLAKLLGITTQTIRNYESYGIVKTTRDGSNFRAFDEESINTLFKCRRLMSMGFSTKQIVEIANGVSYAEGQKMLKAQAEKIRAEGEAEYMRILSEAYNDESKADYYNYIRSLDALKVSLKGSNKTIILNEDSELARILQGN